MVGGETLRSEAAYARHRTGNDDVDEIALHSGAGASGTAMSVYELGSFAERAVSGGMLPPAWQGPGQWRGWGDVEGIRRAFG